VSDLKDRIDDILSILFQIEKHDLEGMAYGIEPWDSLAHMNLITSLEEEFEIRLSDNDVTDMLNVLLVYDIVQDNVNYLINKA
jgi:acyl carrier protein